MDDRQTELAGQSATDAPGASGPAPAHVYLHLQEVTAPEAVALGARDVVERPSPQNRKRLSGAFPRAADECRTQEATAEQMARKLIAR